MGKLTIATLNLILLLDHVCPYLKKVNLGNLFQHLELLLMTIWKKKGRHLRRNFRLCPFCHNVIECEFHFFMVCPLYKELRLKYIPQKMYMYPNLNTFYILMASTDMAIVRNISMFIYYASRKRTTEIKIV